MAQRYRGSDRDYRGNPEPPYWEPREGERSYSSRGEGDYESRGGRGAYGRPARRFGSQDAAGMDDDAQYRRREGMSRPDSYHGRDFEFEDDWQRSQYSTTGRPYGEMTGEPGGGMGYRGVYGGQRGPAYGQGSFGDQAGYGGQGGYGAGQGGFGRTSMDTSGMTGQYGMSDQHATGSHGAGQPSQGWQGRAWQDQGYRGRGPKGYQRSNERLKEDICERLTEAPDIDASDITVQCNNGIVTLEGTVESRHMKHRAEDVVDSCSGVKDVENRLRVSSGQQHAGQSGMSGQSEQGRPEQGRRPLGPLAH